MFIARLDILEFSGNQEPTRKDDMLHAIQDRVQPFSSKADWGHLTRSNYSTFYYCEFGEGTITIMSEKEEPLFIKDLSNFVASLFMSSAEPFQKEFICVDNVPSWKYGDYDGRVFHPHKATPILLQGYIARGKESFFRARKNKDGSEKKLYVVDEATYRRVVNAESRGKGPRLFCDQSIIDWINASSESDVKDLKKLIRCVEDDGKKTYELVWTIDACECGFGSSRGVSLTDPMSNVCSCMTENLFLPAKNLYKGYKKKGDEEAVKHYEELMHLIVNGLLKYLQNKGIADVKTIEDGLSKRMSNIGLAVTDWYKFMDE